LTKKLFNKLLLHKSYPIIIFVAIKLFPKKERNYL